MIRECILSFGAPGSGKSTAGLSIARLIQEAGLPNKMHIIDPDNGIIRLLENEFPELTNICYYYTPTWYGQLTCMECGKEPNKCRCGIERWSGGVKAAFSMSKNENRIGRINKTMKPDDWIMLDMAQNLWEDAQQAFVEKIFDTGIDEYFLEVRKKLDDGAKRLDALEGWKDWTVIKAMHNAGLVGAITRKTPCHVYITSSVTRVDPNAKEDKQVKEFYGNENIRIEGEKHLPSRVQSILHFEHRRGEWFFSTFLKDRGRSWVEREPLYDFGQQYLVDIAGWNV